VGNWVSVMSAAGVREGEPIECTISGWSIALFRVGHDVFATDSLCTHGAARLCDGFQEGFAIECPLHQGRFDVRTGRCMSPPVTRELRVYPIRLVDGQIEIQLED